MVKELWFMVQGEGLLMVHGSLHSKAVKPSAKERGDGYLFHRKTKSVIINS